MCIAFLNFAQFDHDYYSNTDHAQLRQYSSTQGRWLSPDPYSGSYSFSNPQSLNRYAYTANSPVSSTDSSGLKVVDCVWSGCSHGGPCGGSGGGGSWGAGGYGAGYTPISIIGGSLADSAGQAETDYAAQVALAFALTGEIQTVLSSLVCQRVFLICMLFCLAIPLLHAQEIHIRVLNGQNGKAITDECLNVWLAGWHDGTLVAPTDSEGEIILNFRNNNVAANAVPHAACGRTAVLGPRSFSNDTDKLFVAGNLYVACQEYRKIIPGQAISDSLPENRMPSYSIKRILGSGIVASNTCGKIRSEAKPGNLIIFVRQMHWFEKMRQ